MFIPSTKPATCDQKPATSIMKPFFCLMLLIMLSTLLSCVSYKEVQHTKVVSVNVREITAKKMVSDIELQINNPNPYTIRVVNFDLNVFINNLPSGKATIKEKLVLKKKSDDVHRLIIETDMANAATGLFSSLFTRTVKLGLKGDVSAKAYFIKKKIPLDLEETVSY